MKWWVSFVINIQTGEVLFERWYKDGKQGTGITILNGSMAGAYLNGMWVIDTVEV